MYKRQLLAIEWSKYIQNFDKPRLKTVSQISETSQLFHKCLYIGGIESGVANDPEGMFFWMSGSSFKGKFVDGFATDGKLNLRSWRTHDMQAFYEGHVQQWHYDENDRGFHNLDMNYHDQVECTSKLTYQKTEWSDWGIGEGSYYQGCFYESFIGKKKWNGVIECGKSRLIF